MLDPAEATLVADQFGVSGEQVRRDHLLSHLLAALSRELSDAVTFFGGTALARTHLPNGRLSEDIDLFATSRRADVAADIERLFVTAVMREYGRLTWDPPLSAVRNVDPAVLRTHDGLTVRVQLLDPATHPAWSTERRPLIQRYSDTPPAALAVPTLPAFAASKTVAWHDRHLPRDLYDLWGLAKLGALDAAGATLFAEEGPTGNPPRPWMFATPPIAADWIAQLGAQTRLRVDPVEALTIVRKAWEAAAASITDGDAKTR